MRELVVSPICDSWAMRMAGKEHDVPLNAAQIEGEPCPLRKYAVGLHRNTKLQFAPDRNGFHSGYVLDVRRWVRSACQLTAIVLFCGAGVGLDLLQPGFTIFIGVGTYFASAGYFRYESDLSCTDGLLGQFRERGIHTVDQVPDGPPYHGVLRLGRPKVRHGILPTGTLRECR